MLHGCTQSPDDFAAGTRMNCSPKSRPASWSIRRSRAKPTRRNAGTGFAPTDQRRDEGEPSLIAGITRQIMRDYSVDPKRVYVGGLSAGAAAAAIMGATYPDLYAAVGVHSGLACGAASDLPSAFVAMRQGESQRRPDPATFAALRDGPPVPTIVFHGDRDTTVHPSNGDHVIAQSTRTTSPQKQVHRGRIPGGHAYTRTHPYRRERAGDLRALEHSWRRPRLVGRQPRRLLHRSARAGRDEGNAAFLPRAFACGTLEVKAGKPRAGCPFDAQANLPLWSATAGYNRRTAATIVRVQWQNSFSSMSVPYRSIQAARRLVGQIRGRLRLCQAGQFGAADGRGVRARLQRIRDCVRRAGQGDHAGGAARRARPVKTSMSTTRARGMRNTFRPLCAAIRSSSPATTSGKTFTLCVDEDFHGVNREGIGERLFDSAGERTQYLKTVLGFLQAYEAQFDATRAFCQRLVELNLLEAMRAEFTLRTGKRITLGGFMSVNRDRLRALSGDTLARFAALGELDLIYAHLHSQRNFSATAERAWMRRRSPSPRAPALPMGPPADAFDCGKSGRGCAGEQARRYLDRFFFFP